MPVAEPETRRWPREAPGHAEPEPTYQPAPAYQSPPPWEAESQPQPVERETAAEADDAYYDYGTEYDYDAAAPYDSRERASGGPWLILGIIGLGLVALLGGVLLSGLFGGGPGVARQSPTPTVAARATATSGASAAGEGTPPPSSPPSNGPPGTFPDGFTADVQPCASSQMNAKGCVTSGTTLSGDTVWVWAGFTKGNGTDVVGVTLVNAKSGESVQDASLELSRINCGAVCNGYLKFSFNGLPPGDYRLRVNRNGAPAAEAPFTVAG